MQVLTLQPSASPLDRPDWCILPLAGTYAITEGKTLQSPSQAHHIRHGVRRLRIRRAARCRVAEALRHHR